MNEKFDEYEKWERKVKMVKLGENRGKNREKLETKSWRSTFTERAQIIGLENWRFQPKTQGQSAKLRSGF